PIIEDLVLSNDLYEGNMNKIEVMVMDDDADLVISWDMGDGKSYDNAGDNVLHMYMDNGIYEVTITADDGTYITEKTFEIKVYNVAPTIDDVMFDKLGNEGDTISFNALVSDPSPSDMVLVTWTFPDGSTADSSFAQYVFTDDGEFIVLVTASDGEDTTTEQIMVTVENVAPIFTEFVMPSTGQEGEALDFNIAASDPGDDTIVYNVDFGDGTSPLTTQDGGNITHKFAEGDTFTIKICATDEDGGETCREQILPVSILEQLEDSGLPGFNLLAVISALGVISILRRRTH
ncbi:MAG: PKD domain-containing protein, partial [Candidatus Poseidoniia archaeon]|nr:PKD domain-containing protein [Candidatus Poseidoniia archaeon]